MFSKADITTTAEIELDDELKKLQIEVPPDRLNTYQLLHIEHSSMQDKATKQQPDLYFDKSDLN